MTKTKLEIVTDKLQNEKLCKHCQKKLEELAEELYNALKETLGEGFKEFQRQGLVTDLMYHELQNLSTHTVYEIVITYEGKEG